jgi:hypothetical protein
MLICVERTIIAKIKVLTGTNVMTFGFCTFAADSIIHMKRDATDAPMMTGYDTQKLPLRHMIAIATGYRTVRMADDTRGFVLLKNVINTGIIIMIVHSKTPVKSCPNESPGCIYSYHIK